MANFGWIKTVYADDIDGNSVPIKLIYNTYSLICYKNYFGRDMMSDLYGLFADVKTQRAVEKMRDVNTVEGLREMGADEINDITDAVFNEKSRKVYGQIIISLYAAGIYPQKLSAEEIEYNELPIDFMADPEFITALNELILFVCEKEKKKLYAARDASRR